MTDRRRIEYTTDMDASGFESGVRGVRQRLSDMGKAFQENGVVGLSQMSQALGISGRDLVDFARRAVEAGIEAAKMGAKIEAVSKSFDTIFGNAASKMRAQLDETRRSMGLSRSEMESMVLPLGQMATNAGYTERAAADLSGKLLRLAGDVAAFNPLIGDSNDALGAMQAALRGEFDPLERFGSKLTAARVKAEAARLQGIDPMNASLSDQQLQIMAVVSLLEDDFAPALGTLAEQEGTATDSANEMSASWKDLQEDGYRMANETLPLYMDKLADVFREQSNARTSGDLLGQTFRNIMSAAKFAFSPLDNLRRIVFDTGSQANKTGGIMDSKGSPAIKRYGDTSRIIEDALEALNVDIAKTTNLVQQQNGIVTQAQREWGVLANKIIAAKLEYLELRNVLGGSGGGTPNPPPNLPGPL